MEQWKFTLEFILSIIAIIGTIGALFYWKGSVDSILKKCSLLPDRTKELEDKMNIVWALCVDQILKDKPHLAKRGSGYKLTPEGEACLAEIGPAIEEILRDNKDIKPSDALILLSRKVGYAELQEMIHHSGCSLSEFYSLATVKMGVSI